MPTHSPLQAIGNRNSKSIPFIGRKGQMTYSVAAHSGNDRLADCAYEVPIFQKLVLVRIRVCVMVHNLGLTQQNEREGAKGRTLFVLHLLDVGAG